MNIDVQLIEKVVKKVLTDVESACPADDLCIPGGTETGPS